MNAKPSRDAEPFLPETPAERADLDALRHAASECQGCGLDENATVFIASRPRLSPGGSEPNRASCERCIASRSCLGASPPARSKAQLTRSRWLMSLVAGPHQTPVRPSKPTPSRNPHDHPRPVGRQAAHPRGAERGRDARVPSMAAGRAADPGTGRGRRAGRHGLTALLGSSFRVTKQRGVPMPLPDLETIGTPSAARELGDEPPERADTQLLATIHPSAVLRAEDRDQTYAGFLDDLKTAASVLH